ncbi:hypothetical protein RclHR1_08530012 [Rhizophagus clarus]|uniref:Uncharacterized protein n=1 Tax=Rhizophagus clarus TaxID=94130 RepID=A0A2Z6S3G9_9GLOM|nr:hypothetical protein RclHR1_08530012 [Rhizophagus clarus]
MDTTFYDIEQIIKKIKGQTCYLPPIEINSKRKTRTAYIYVKPEDYQHEIWNVPVGKDRTIYITPSNHSVCSVCGDHNHNVSTCNRYESLEPYLRPNKEQRVEVIDTRTKPETTAQDITAQDPDPESTPRPRTTSPHEADPQTRLLPTTVITTWLSTNNMKTK